MLIYTFSGTTVLLGLGGLCLLVLLVILLLRRLRAPQSVKGKAASVFSYRAPLHRLSLCVAILATFLTINWTQPESGPHVYDLVMDTEDIIEVDIPPTDHKPPPPPPPPPPPVIEATPEPEVETVDFIDQGIDDQEPVLAPPPQIAEPTPAPPPPPPPPPVEESSEPLLFVERMPVFGSECFGLSGEEAKQCSDRALLSFVQSRVKYPTLARENNIQGTVVVQFTVEKDGSISDVKVVRKVGGGCSEAAQKAVEAISREGERFKPGIQAGLPVRVRFNLPVKFALE
ncbi:energy transducer TonB [Lewinella sp. W8]|uniref:energy transducer TonB n=1 Tax=Lewinella sp. W8 TaxID=2528208 RepID=UPI0010675F5B|nr:energy transducer TonB [Lewinella sp. W8]MTB50069.1 TonB family protein [Lewinella sp. W8]